MEMSISRQTLATNSDATMTGTSCHSWGSPPWVHHGSHATRRQWRRAPSFGDVRHGILAVANHLSWAEARLLRTCRYGAQGHLSLASFGARVRYAARGL